MLVAIIFYMLYYAAIVVAILIAVSLVGWLSYISVRHLYVGSVKNPSADPLFAKAAKYVTNKQKKSVSELSAYLSVDEKRVRFICKQLELANILDGDQVLVHSKWKLGKIFREINKDEHYFESRIKSRIKEDHSQRQLQITNQLKTERDPRTIQLLNTYKDHLQEFEYLHYLIEEQASGASTGNSEQIKEIEESCNHDAIDCSVDSEHVKAFEKFSAALLAINEGKVWNGEHQLMRCKKENLPFLRCNGNIFYVPSFQASPNRRCYFYPSFIIVLNKGKAGNWFIRCIEYKDVKIKYKTSYLEKASWFNEKDANVAFHNYLHTRADGGPDLRYSYNPSIPYYSFIQATWSTPLNIRMIFPYSDKIKKIQLTLTDLKKNCSPQKTIRSSIETISKGERKEKDPLALSLHSDDEIYKKISRTIVQHDIKKETVKRQTLVHILNDYQIFQTVEEKVCSRILKELINLGILENILCANPSTNEGQKIIDSFVKRTGYDTNIVHDISVSVYSGFKACGN